MNYARNKDIIICAECDAQEQIEVKRAGDESWFYCPACETIEGRTKEATINHETGEIELE